MRTLLNAAFAFLLVGFATGAIPPVHDARWAQMRADFALLHPGAPMMRGTLALR